ncbi:MAG TPA: DUF4476 domain-containing protein [Bacteroidales bacterium]
MMSGKMVKMMIVLFFAGAAFTNAQRDERRRPLSTKDLIVMKLDSIDQFYFSHMRTRERFDAQRRLDDVVQLVNQLGSGIEEREKSLREREKMLDERERALDERERALRRDHDNIRDRDNDRDEHRDRVREAARVSPMDQQDFDQLMGMVERTPFAQDKKKIISTSAMSNYFLIDQVVKLTSKFSFDNDRLDVIQLLYPRILNLDKNYLLYDCLTFSDSKNKLQRFIESNVPPTHP